MSAMKLRFINYQTIYAYVCVCVCVCVWGGGGGGGGRDIICLLISTLPQEHPFRESKMNAVAHAQLTFEILTLQTDTHTYIYMLPLNIYRI